MNIIVTKYRCKTRIFSLCKTQTLNYRHYITLQINSYLYKTIIFFIKHINKLLYLNEN